MTTEPWLKVTPEQYKQGWMELRGVTPMHHNFVPLGQDEAGNYIVRNPQLYLEEHPLKLTLRSDVRYECPICHWRISLTFEGEREWLKDGAIMPRCAKDHITLERTLLSR